MEKNPITRSRSFMFFPLVPACLSPSLFIPAHSGPSLLVRPHPRLLVLSPLIRAHPHLSLLVRPHPRPFHSCLSLLIPTLSGPSPLVRARPHLFGPVPARSDPSPLIPAHSGPSPLIPACPCSTSLDVLRPCSSPPVPACLYAPALMLVRTRRICTCVYAPVLVCVHLCLHLQSFVSTQLTLFVHIWGVDRVLPGASFVLPVAGLKIVSI